MNGARDKISLSFLPVSFMSSANNSWVSWVYNDSLACSLKLFISLLMNHHQRRGESLTAGVRDVWSAHILVQMHYWPIKL